MYKYICTNIYVYINEKALTAYFPPTIQEFAF